MDEKDLGLLKFGSHIPFNKSDNPVMSTLAFLIGLVDPKIVQELTQRAIDLHGAKKEVPDSDAKSTVKDGTEVALATLGLRSHVFATNQERLMNKTTNEMITKQINKIDLKLKTLDTMEKSLELERKSIQKRQEDVFIQRLSLTKHANSVMGKFKSLLAKIPESQNLKDELEELDALIKNPPKTSIVSQPLPSQTSEDLESSIKPISIDAPQLYRYWSG